MPMPRNLPELDTVPEDNPLLVVRREFLPVRLSFLIGNSTSHLSGKLEKQALRPGG